jgi:hypothetical protein
MKKLLFLLFLVPAISSAESYNTYVTNAFAWSLSQTTSTTMAWQIYNAPTNSNSLYINKIDVSAQGGGYFTLYSSNTAAAYTGLRSTVTATSLLVGFNGSGTSTVVYSSNAVPVGGNIIWQGCAIGSATVSVMRDDDYIAVKPGYTVYLTKTGTSATDKTSASFIWRESPR